MALSDKPSILESLTDTEKYFNSPFGSAEGMSSTPNPEYNSPSLNPWLSGEELFNAMADFLATSRFGEDWRDKDTKQTNSLQAMLSNPNWINAMMGQDSDWNPYTNQSEIDNFGDFTKFVGDESSYEDYIQPEYKSRMIGQADPFGWRKRPEDLVEGTGVSASYKKDINALKSFGNQLVELFGSIQGQPEDFTRDIGVFKKDTKRSIADLLNEYVGAQRAGRYSNKLTSEDYTPKYLSKISSIEDKLTEDIRDRKKRYESDWNISLADKIGQFA